MPIEVRKALEILSEVLVGDKPSRFFLQKRIAIDGLNIEPSQFNHKLSGRQSFNKADYMRLALYFGLGEEGFKLFHVENEEAFRVGLRDLGIGRYTKEPAQILSQRLFTAAKESSATLEIFDITSSLNNRSGLESVENAGPSTGLNLYIGDRIRLKFRYPIIKTESLSFVVLNIHCASGAVRVLNPVYKENTIQLRSDQVIYPESNYLEVKGAMLLGTHRLIAIACTSSFRRTLLAETSRLLTIFNGTDEIDADNQFDGLLDRTALENINRATLTGVIHCAVLEYRQVHGAQQP